MKPSDLKRIAEGREAEIFAWEDGKVLRLFRSEHAGEAVRREAAAMEAVRAVMPLVPAVEEVVQVDGRPGLVLDRVDGPDLLTRLGRRPWTVWQAGALTGRVHAELHQASAAPTLPSQKERIARKLGDTRRVPVEIAEPVRVRLQALPDGDRLLHGDMHPANIILTNSGPVVIDWPNAARGDPTADIARTLILGRASPTPDGTPPAIRSVEKLGRRLLLRAYLRAYRRVRPIDQDLLERWLVVRAADRLEEGIEEERDWLLQFVREALAKGP